MNSKQNILALFLASPLGITIFSSSIEVSAIVAGNPILPVSISSGGDEEEGNEDDE